jgi:hypothetical protein
MNKTGLANVDFICCGNCSAGFRGNSILGAHGNGNASKLCCSLLISIPTNRFANAHLIIISTSYAMQGLLSLCGIERATSCSVLTTPCRVRLLRAPCEFVQTTFHFCAFAFQ